MHPKQKKIIEVSIELFAKKGFHATSVQEIVDRANVAKGSFYNYFESKEKLILSMYDYYYGLIMKKMNEVKDINNPKDSLHRQLEIYFKFLLENKPLIAMLMRDQVPLGEDVKALVLKTKQSNFEWAKESVLYIYGKQIEHYANEVAVLFEGIIKNYVEWLVFDEDSVDVQYLPQFLIDRLDDICTKILEYRPKKVIKHLPDIFHDESLLISRMKQHIQSTMIEDKEKALEAIEVIESELQKNQPKKIVLESILMHLNQYESLKDDIELLEKLLDKRE